MRIVGEEFFPFVDRQTRTARDSAAPRLWRIAAWRRRRFWLLARAANGAASSRSKQTRTAPDRRPKPQASARRLASAVHNRANRRTVRSHTVYLFRQAFRARRSRLVAPCLGASQTCGQSILPSRSLFHVANSLASGGTWPHAAKVRACPWFQTPIGGQPNTRRNGQRTIDRKESIAALPPNGMAATSFCRRPAPGQRDSAPRGPHAQKLEGCGSPDRRWPICRKRRPFRDARLP